MMKQKEQKNKNVFNVSSGVFTGQFGNIEEENINIGRTESGKQEPNKGGSVDIVKEVIKIKDAGIENLKELEKTKNLVHLGFIIILIMFVGIVFEFFDGKFSREVETKMNIKDQKENISKLEKRFDNIANCMKDKQCWEYKYCFE